MNVHLTTAAPPLTAGQLAQQLLRYGLLRPLLFSSEGVRQREATLVQVGLGLPHLRFDAHGGQPSGGHA